MSPKQLTSLTSLIEPDDRIYIAQGAGQPYVLSEMLQAEAAELPRAEVFLGLTLQECFTPELAGGLEFLVTGGFGMNQGLVASGRARVLPVQLHQLAEQMRSGHFKIDISFIETAPPDAQGRCSTGATGDFIYDAIKNSRVVVAEFNSRAPRVESSSYVALDQIDYFVESDRQLPQVPAVEGEETSLRIAERVAALIEDRCVLQVGIGKVPDILASLLHDRKDLGVHTGMIGDSLMDLIESGAVTNHYKEIDPGQNVTGTLIGTDRLYAWASDNPALKFAPVTHTHSPKTLASISNLVAVNSAFEVDIFGQVNSEVSGGRYLGAIGGQVDFMRGAAGSASGRSIIALASANSRATASRIVADLDCGNVSTLRTDVDFVVTEWGVADLRCAGLDQRCERMIAVAHPEFRAALEQRAEETLSKIGTNREAKSYESSRSGRI